jgi:hypothetical protein
VDEYTWDACTGAAMLGLDIILKIATSEETLDRQFLDVMRKWAVTIKTVIEAQKSEEIRQELEYLTTALEDLTI